MTIAMVASSEDVELPIDPEQLRRLPFLAPLEGEDLTLLASHARRESLPARTTICRRGEPADSLFIVESGHVLLFVSRPGDPAGIVRVVGPNETFGECSLLPDMGSPVTAETFDPAELILIPVDPLRALVTKRFDVMLAMLGHVSIRLRRLLGQVGNLKTRTTTQRLAAHLVGLATSTAGVAEIPLRYGKTLLAHELGMQPETFSRAMMKLQSLGVRYRRSREAFFVEDIAALRNFCEEEG